MANHPNRSRQAIRLVLDVKLEAVANALCAAIESSAGSHYWIQEVSAKPGAKPVKPWGDRETPEYVEAPFSGVLEVTCEDHTNKGPGARSRTYKLNMAGLRDGLQAFAKECPLRFGALLSDETDATDGDALLQCCLFGEVMYE